MVSLCDARFVDAMALLTTLSRREVAHGLVRISAEMVGILLNSSCPNEIQRVTREFGVGLQGKVSGCLLE
jgi:hypothetical protein